jgi:hypothetical protein
MIEQGKKYIIMEVVKPGTPEEIARLGRTRAPGKASEQELRVPYDMQRKTYDIGLTKKSKEFIGKSADEMAKILKERANIIEAFEVQYGIDFANTPDMEQKLNDIKINTYHGKLYNTADLKDFTHLYLLFYSKKACLVSENKAPETFYEIVEDGSLVDKEGIFIEKSAQLNSDFLQIVNSDKQMAINILYLLGEQRINVGTKNSMLLTKFKQHSESREQTTYKNKTIEKYELVEKVMNEDKETIDLKSKVLMSMSSFENTSEGYYYRGSNIGKTQEDIFKYFSNNKDLYSKLLVETSK